ncbi:sodium:proton antiporter [Myxosarcina sp. GI1]|uniref:cation:proton antiporter n=1 Tax=Myxosarcina sp. GI1 TaxID=1541065 RepID=UPI000566AE1A|nr:sodium:proton antiporter [Myxosarcina sp. GI1]
MDEYILNLLIIGLLLLVVTLGSGWINRLPLSYSLIYLIVGIALGPYGFKLIEIRPDAQFLERLTEFVVIVSVFGCGLKVNRPLKLQTWQTTIRLIGFLMPFSILCLAVLAHWVFGMGWGAAILLGAILSPTDPVLASEVQLANVEDKDELRFSLTSEGGLNDSLAFPFVYFGISALKDSNWDNWFKQWVAVDLIWAVVAGVVMGIVVAKVIVWCDSTLQKRRKADELLEDFLAISLILLSYSLTELIHGYGFLAVFVSGLIVEQSYCIDRQKRLAQLKFTQQNEKLLEVTTILIIGTILSIEPIVNYLGQSLLLAGLLFFIIRPIGIWLGTINSNLPTSTKHLVGWFGIRGIGSIYYLTYALGESLDGPVAEQISWITFTVVVISIVVHGISAAPLMKWYEKQETSGKQLV